jgi:FkbM family methyltransferase
MNLEKHSFNTYIKDDSVVYDIGAHLGELSVAALDRGAKIVHAFEPSDFNIRELTALAEQKPQINVHHVGLHLKNYSCFTRFKDCADNRLPIELDTPQNIKYVNLEDYVIGNQLELPDFIKMDIEGMEALVLTTFDFLFKGVRPVIYTEIHAAERGQTLQNYKDNPHWKYPDEGGFDFNDLKALNYKIYKPEGEVSSDEDYNPAQKTHSGLLLVPQN